MLGAALDPARHPFSRDVAWYGITRWRELIAGLFDPPDARDALNQIATVEISAVSDAADGIPRAAAWLAAWLAGQLGWERSKRESPGPGRVEATFRGPSGEVAVTIATTADASSTIGRLAGVAIAAKGPGGPWQFRLDRPDREGAEVRIVEARPGQAECDRTLSAPEPDDAGRLAAAPRIDEG